MRILAFNLFNPMEPAKTVSKTRIILTWIMMIAMVICITTFFFFLNLHNAPAPQEETGGPQGNPIVHAIFFAFIGILFLVAGLGAYFVLIFTCCLTFNYSKPVWDAVKGKQYLAKIVVTVALALGIGCLASAFLGPLITRFGIPTAQADVAPIVVAAIGFQLALFWVLIWAPVEKRTIMKRLGTMGITPAQIRGATLIGISNPASGMGKRFAAIEEDIGALWVTPDRLAFRGDVEQFDLTRDQIAQIERKADNRSTSVLAGIAHVVLHVWLPDGSIRQMRLHTEGQWTLGQKRRAMDALAEAINGWYAQQAAPAVN